MSVDDLRWRLSRQNERQVYEVFATGATTAEALRAAAAEPGIQIVGDPGDGRAHVPGRVAPELLRVWAAQDQAVADEIEAVVAIVERVLVDAGLPAAREVAVRVADELYDAGYFARGYDD